MVPLTIQVQEHRNSSDYRLFIYVILKAVLNPPLTDPTVVALELIVGRKAQLPVGHTPHTTDTTNMCVASVTFFEDTTFHVARIIQNT
jgi:hypothetical protein